LGEPKIRALNDAWWHAGGNVLVQDRSFTVAQVPITP